MSQASLLPAGVPARVTRAAFLRWVLGAGLGLGLTGCGSLSGPGSASFASVTIPGHTAQEIAAATTRVFRAEGYAGGGDPAGQMVFQREASRATGLARSGLVATHEGASTLIRVRVDIVSLEGGSHRLQCQAYTVTGAGDAFFEDEVRLTNIRSAPYRSLLNQVKSELK